jgi:hypothetical protein
LILKCDILVSSLCISKWVNLCRYASGWSPAEVEICGRIAGVMREEAGRGVDKTRAWDAAWKDVYALAAAICDRVMGEWTTGVCPRGGGGGGGVTARRAKM